MKQLQVFKSTISRHARAAKINTEKPIMPKIKSRAFGKDIFLLGQDADGKNYWLESPRWDCNWYWGFGYIETYTNNNNPSAARDIESHSHASKFMSEYFTEWNGSKPILKYRTFTDQEGWELSELFAQFYHLQKQAEFWKRGKMNTANTKVQSWTDEKLAEKINQEMIPAITVRILEILTPKNKAELTYLGLPADETMPEDIL